MHIIKRILLIALLFVPAVSYAQVFINEVLYSPTSKQWIEIYNNTDQSIDITQYKILDSGAAINGHAVSAVSSGNLIPSHGYGVIAKDPTTVSASSIFKSSLGIKTTGDTVILKNGSAVIDTVSIPDGSATNGNSYQKTDTGWASGTPTPGALNSIPQTPPPDPGEPNGTTTPDGSGTQNQTQGTLVTPSSHYSFVPISDAPSDQKFSVSAGRDRLGFVNIPLKFKALLNTNDPNTSFFWTFGDGSKDQGRDVEHTYLYPGEYTVVLNSVLFDHESVSRVLVKIVSPEVSISEDTSEYTAVKNNSKYEINLYGWHLQSGKKIFEFPKDTIIGAGSTVKFPKSVLGISQGEVLSIDSAVSQIERFKQNQMAIDNSQEVNALYQQVIALKALNQKNRQDYYTAPSYTSHESNINQTAAAVNIFSSSTATSSDDSHGSWLTLLKKFFFGSHK